MKHALYRGGARVLAFAAIAAAQAGAQAGAQAAASVSPETPKRVMAAYRKPSAADLKRALSPLQYEVTQQDGTESAFKNDYWNNHEAGLYVDVVSGEPLFSSLDKYESGTGWPAFTRPLDATAIVKRKDSRFFMTRVEVRSKRADSHLGHLFNDGPQPAGLRYCINSAALRFIPAGKLAAEGYGEYAKLFADTARK